MENSKKNGYPFNKLLLWQQSGIRSHERKINPWSVANLNCEYQELKPKVQSNSSFLVILVFLDVDTVNTVGSHLFKPKTQSKYREFVNLIISTKKIRLIGIKRKQRLQTFACTA